MAGNRFTLTKKDTDALANLLAGLRACAIEGPGQRYDTVQDRERRYNDHAAVWIARLMGGWEAAERKGLL